MIKVIQAEVLAPYTTFKIGGPAKFFVIVKKEEEMLEALKWAKDNKEKYLILGKGANILVSDKGYDGLVIKNEMKSLDCRDGVTICQSGLLVNEMMAECTKKGISGLEFMAGIPSTIGGAIVGNAGGLKKSIGDYIKLIRVIDKNLQAKELTKEQCQFGYRRSIFQKGEYVILAVTFNLESGNTEKIVESVQNIIHKKNKIQPLEYPSAGCAFKNPDGMSAGQIIDELGLKGKTMGGAKISEKHANYIINTGYAKAEDVVMMISYIKQQARDKKGIQLQEEIKYIGFDDKK